MAVPFLYRPSKIPHKISSILFILDTYGSLASLENKIRKCLSFQGSTRYVKYQCVSSQGRAIIGVSVLVNNQVEWDERISS